MTDHISYITEKCHLSNPKLKELSFGMKIRHFFDWRIWTYIWYKKDKYAHDCFIWYEDWQEMDTQDISDIWKCHLGHPIQLSDILLAISKNLKQGDCLNAHINSYNQLSFRTLEIPWLVDWNLLLPLTEQTPETIQWIADLMGYNS